MEIVERLKADYLSYTGYEKHINGDLISLLRTVVEGSKYSPQDLFTNQDILRLTLKEASMEEIDIDKLCIVSRVPGFESLLHRDFWTDNEVNSFVQNADKESGLKKVEIMRIMSAIGQALNKIDKSFEYNYVYETVGQRKSARTSIVPRKYYEGFIKSTVKQIESKKPLEESVQKELGIMARMGIPAAQYCLGRLILESGDNLKEEMKESGEGKSPLDNSALSWLESAMQDGDMDAGGYLGDLYYGTGQQNWSKAYACYTVFGGVGLKGSQRRHLINILKQSERSGKMVQYTVFYALFLIIVSFMLQYKKLINTNWLCFALFVFSQAALTIFVFLKFRKDSFSRYLYYPVCTFLLWSLYLVMVSVL